MIFEKVTLQLITSNRLFPFPLVARIKFVACLCASIPRLRISPRVFAPDAANEFPAQFEGVVRRVLRLLYHVVAHLYAAHFRELALLRLHAHMHLTFAHLTALDRRFALLDPKETEVTASRSFNLT